MGTPSAFFSEALPWARSASARTGVLTSVVLAQWADETEFGGPDWAPNNNPGNVGSFDGRPVASFPTLAEGVDAYVQLMDAPDRPAFAATIRTAPGAIEQCVLLGQAEPVWASGHYGNPPGSDLVQLIDTYNLTQYDEAPTPQEAEEMTSIIIGGQLHVFGMVGTTTHHWWQEIGPPASTWHTEILPAQ